MYSHDECTHTLSVFTRWRVFCIHTLERYTLGEGAVLCSSSSGSVTVLVLVLVLVLRSGFLSTFRTRFGDVAVGDEFAHACIFTLAFQIFKFGDPSLSLLSVSFAGVRSLSRTCQHVLYLPI